MHASNVLFLAIAHVLMPLTAEASGVEFDAAVGRTGYGRCHMEGCGFFIIDSAVPVGSIKDGTLFAISYRSWDAEYKAHGDNDMHEYDRAPISVSKQKSSISVVFCSKTRPVEFDYFENKWHSTELRPGDETSVFGYNESTYLFYWAACHHYITHDATSKSMALKLGYTFANEPSNGNDQESDDSRYPMDVLVEGTRNDKADVDNAPRKSTDTAAPKTDAEHNEACKKDFTRCTDNTDFMNNSNALIPAQVACKQAAEAKSKFGDPKWPWLSFSNYSAGNEVKTGRLLIGENNAQFQNAFGAWEHVRVVCEYDLKAEQVISVDIIPKE